MTNPWNTEAEEREDVKPLGREDWDSMPITKRVARAKLSGREGKLGAKFWDDMTPDERASIIDPESRPAKLDYQIKAHVVLEDSLSENWGMVKYLKPGTYSLEAIEGEIVGNWSISPTDGFIHVFLETPLTALADRAVQEFAKYAEMRKDTASIPKSIKSRTRTPKAPAPEPEPNENQVKIDGLRRMLAGGKTTRTPAPPSNATEEYGVPNTHAGGANNEI